MKTPLLLASENEFEGLVELLLERKADVNAKDKVSTYPNLCAFARDLPWAGSFSSESFMQRCSTH